MSRGAFRTAVMAVAGLVLVLLAPGPATSTPGERRYRHHDWTIRAFENVWTRRFEGVAVAPAFAEAKGGRNGEVLILCAAGRPRLGIRWPQRLEEQHQSRQRFSLRLDAGIAETHEFEPSNGSIVGHANGGYYISANDGLFFRASRSEELFIAVAGAEQDELRARLQGFAAAAFDMTAICAGRLP
ncbi:hypothetical protein [Phreatobacter oligotrophus]|uniref:Apolipoprotein D and lipocalin family protein n=1 Tax=Phreatobacter oligotrophus TaxID=1122261 RepID=A0A2T4YWW7_9HYPH|nr:hypothetical protein [Phreatobacter oligotrophus]PTM49811.1 hypothetical protein C8P69_1176 [Phreatobacter oligotrophus]